MNPFHVSIRKNIVPGLLVLVSIWTLYFGAAALFCVENDEATRDDIRSTQRQLNNQSDQVRTAKITKLRTSRPDESRTAAEENKGAKPESKRPATAPVQKPAVSIGVILSAKKKPSLPVPPKSVARVSQAPQKTDALRARILEEAYNLALKSPEPWKNLIEVAREHYRKGDKLTAREILVIAENLAIDPDSPKETSASVREVVKAMLSIKLTEDAMEALQNISTVRERERAMAEVSAWSARKGDMETAKKLVSQIVDTYARDLALVAIAETEASFEGTSLAIQTVSLISNKQKKDDAYRRIAMKRALLNDFSGAEQSVTQIRSSRIKDATNASLARLRARSGDVNGGLQMLRNIGNLSIEDATLRDLSTELAGLGRFSDGLLVASRIRDDKEKSYALESLSVEQAKTGDLSAALANVSSIPVDILRDRGLRNVSAATANNGDSARARNVAVRIESDRERDRAYRAIAQAAAADGDHHDAFNTMQNISQPEEKALALVSMARYRLREGDHRQAFSLLEHARGSIPQDVRVSARDQIHASMALVYAESSESALSLTLAESIANPRRRDATLGSLARALALNNDIPTAQRSIQSISTEKIRITAEDNVARTVASKTKPQQAVKTSRKLDSSRQRILFLLTVSRKS